MTTFGLGVALWGTWTAGAAAFEAWHRHRVRGVPHRFLVSGIRGKTTATRLLHAGLRAAGRSALGRVTGDEPLLLMPDGSERRVRRWGPANIREMRRAARMAASLKCDALCFENMAIRPDLARLVAEFAVLPTSCLFAFDGLDHAEELAADPRERARELLGAIPGTCALIVPDAPRNAAFLAEARASGRRLNAAQALDAPGLRPHAAFLVAAVLEALRAAGCEGAVVRDAVIAEVTRLQTIRAYKLGESFVVDLLSANDPDSVRDLLSEMPQDKVPVTLFYMHRRDRPGRLRAFLPTLRSMPSMIAGDAVPPAFLRRHSLEHGTEASLFQKSRAGLIALVGNSGGRGRALRERLQREAIAESW